MSIGGYFAEMVQSGALLVAAPLAMIAGLVSFISPCILPLVPGYLGYVSGLADPARPDSRRRVLGGVGLFIFGFAAVFTLYGAAFGVIGGWLLQWQDALIRVLGVFVVLMGAWSWSAGSPSSRPPKNSPSDPGPASPGPRCSVWSSDLAGPPAWARPSVPSWP